MKKAITLSGLTLILLVLVAPLSAQAINIWTGARCGGAPIGPDGGPEGPCSLCDAMIVGRNVITYLFEFAFLIGTLMTAWGGMKMMLAAGDPGKLSEARQTMLSAVIGIAVAVSAWTIVNTLLSFLSPSGIAAPWATITC